MALNYDYRNVENSDEVMFDGDKIRPVSEVIIFRTMYVGIPEITSDNYKQFYTRCMIISVVNNGGPLARSNDEGGLEFYDITLEDCKNHIGLSTNASPLTAKQFANKWVVSNV